MSNFFGSFRPLIKKVKLRKFLIEICLLTVALFITIASLFIYINNNQGRKEETEVSENIIKSPTIPTKIFIDVSGSVKKPDLYEMNFGSRIKEAIDKAGGLSDEADIIFFRRNFNLARIVGDQEKIYIPSAAEVNNGIFIQTQRTLDYILPNAVGLDIPSKIESPAGLINLNSATVEELDQLPGIGQVTSNKIVTNRPYTTAEELLSKKIVNKSVYEKIKNLISAN